MDLIVESGVAIYSKQYTRKRGWKFTGVTEFGLVKDDVCYSFWLNCLLGEFRPSDTGYMNTIDDIDIIIIDFKRCYYKVSCFYGENNDSFLWKSLKN